MNYQEFPKSYFEKADTRIPTVEEFEKKLAPFKRYLVKFVKELPHNAKVLDVGCGTGKAIKMIRVYRPDVTVYATDITDMSAYMPQGVEFKKGSAEELDKMYPANFFDGIVCQHVIEHLLHPMPMINAMKAVLKKGGRFYIETPNWTRSFAPFAHLYFWNDYTHLRIFTPFAFNKLFIEHGFSVDNVVSVSSTTFFVRKYHVSSEKRTESDLGSANLIARSKAPLIFRIMSRIINPFLRDILIGIATKK